jgi:uncharacterized integral membrane protein
MSEQAPVTDEAEAEAEPKPKPKRDPRESARSATLLMLAIIITIFAVLNLDTVKVDWIFGSGKAPLIVVIVISLLVGIVLTHFAERRAAKRR